MNSYSTQKVADLVGMKPDQVRHFVRRNVLQPGRGPKGEYRFAFQDMVLLRTAKGLIESDISARELFRALRRLKAGAKSLPALSSVRMEAHSGAVVIRNEDKLWNAQTGQGCLEFAPSGPGRSDGGALAPLWSGVEDEPQDPEELDSDEWRQLGVDLEDWDAGKAFEAYERALELDPRNADAHVNIGRLYQLKGQLKNAKRHYEMAVEAAPHHQLAHYNLGTLFDELSEGELAANFYHRAPDVPDAHYNLARIFRQRGDELAYRRHRQLYQRLLKRESS